MENKNMPYTFVPEKENRDYLSFLSRKNRRSMSAEINMLIEAARINDESYKPEVL